MFNTIISQLLEWSLKIKNQTQIYGNTETLVGGLFEQIILFLSKITDYITNILIGIILKGDKANEAEIQSIINAERGDTWKALDTNHYWSFDGVQWNDIGEILPSDLSLYAKTTDTTGTVIRTGDLAQAKGNDTTLAPSLKLFTDEVNNLGKNNNDILFTNSGFNYIIGLSVNFEFSKIELIQFYNRDATGQTYYAQIVTFRVTYSDNTTNVFTYTSGQGGGIASGSETHSITMNDKVMSFVVRWNGTISSANVLEVNAAQVQILPLSGKLAYSNIDGLALETEVSNLERISEFTVTEKALSESITVVNVTPYTLVNDTITFHKPDSLDGIILLGSSINSFEIQSSNNPLAWLILGTSRGKYISLDFSSTMKGQLYVFTTGIIGGDGQKIADVPFTLPVPFQPTIDNVRFSRQFNVFKIDYYKNNQWNTLFNFDLSDYVTIDTYQFAIHSVLTTDTIVPFLRLEQNKSLEISNEAINPSLLTSQDSDTILLSEDDFDDTNGFYINKESVLIADRLSGSVPKYVIFKEEIKAIEFEVASLFDSNLFSLCFGTGTEDTTTVFAGAYLPTSVRPTQASNLSNYITTNTQVSSIEGRGRFSTPYQSPQKYCTPLEIGDICRIELVQESVFIGKVKRNNTWIDWFILDTKGIWTIPDRVGWNDKIRIGFSVVFNVSSGLQVAKNIKVIKRDAIGDTARNKILAIGDSETAIDSNNGLSYIGYAARKNNLSIVNKGFSGWTAYRLNRDWDTTGIDTALESLNEGDIITMLIGTNDFDTGFYIPTSDEDMDAHPDPHPRFGTFDANDSDYKNPHTTLGSFRLLIERIQTQRPDLRLFIFAPFYREKKGIENGQFTKMLINSEGRTIYDYADAICKVANEYNLPNQNLARMSGVNAATIESYTYDFLHLNQQGGELIGNHVSTFMR